MSAPYLWIILPIFFGLFTFILVNEHATAMAGGIVSAGLALLALVLPIDQAMLLGPVSLKVASSVSFLGRSLVLPPASAALLALIFGLCAVWFFGAEAAGVARRLIPLGLIITGLLVASLAVQPFLFASLLIETAVLVAVPLLSEPGEGPRRGLLRFLIYQTLGMPFILLAGWLLAGVESSPGDISFTLQSTVTLGLGFAFLLAIFPFYNWIPEIMEESSPYAAGFLIWLLPTIIIVFAMSFLDRYAWLRTSPAITAGLRLSGVIMLVSGAWWAAFERHVGRLMAYTAIAETGFLLLAVGVSTATTAGLVFLFLIPRGFGMAIWALGLSVLRRHSHDFDLASMQGLARRYPFAAAGIVLASLSSAGFPLLAGFPARLALWQSLSAQSSATAVWFLIGLLGLLVGAVRQMAVLVTQTEDPSWKSGEDFIQRGMLGLGVLGLFFLGIFPQAVSFIVLNLPLMFQHLNR